MEKSNRDRQPLKWDKEDTITLGRVIVEIQSAQKEKGKVYSVSISRVIPAKHNREERTSKHLWPQDLTNAVKVIEDAMNWIDVDREEQNMKSRNTFRKA